ncbi:hypothetical protein [Rhodococcus sp. LW-XY12]|uniref:hypothetical protein n=1 Tax=Rhodococcus TaxID=1827 RepID=UPI001C561668|nr:hypothetical protein [Rhodococcus sp. LW-XY12]QXU53236.1 hypothetical protein KXC42_21050 [Rhodococcus sp. LW-XY12]
MMKPDKPPENACAIHWPWPQHFHVVAMLISVLMIALVPVFAALTLQQWTQDDVLAAAGFAGITLGLALSSPICFHEAGIRHLSLSRLVVHHHHPEHGAGIRIPTRRWGISTVVGTALALGTYSLAAAIAVSHRSGESLLPHGRTESEGLPFLIVLVFVCFATAVFLLVVRSDTRLDIYRGGIRRRVCRRVLTHAQLIDHFIPWNEIERIEVGDLGVRLGSAQYPVVDLFTVSPTAEDLRTRHDGVNRFAVMVHQLAVEPNTLFTLMKRLVENPCDRGLLTGSGAVDLLRPPPLRERFRAARQPSRQHGNSR